MLLSESDVAVALETAQGAFPNLIRWEFNNEVTEDYAGFALWGAYVLEGDDPKRVFYVTFDAFRNEEWHGSLTVGKPAYFWSSASVGDARLVHTDDCATLEEAIRALKWDTVKLASDLTGELLAGREANR